MKYPIVHISFLDHNMTDGDNMHPAKCEAIGYLIAQDKQTITIATWICDSIINSHNTEVFVLIKHKGMKVKRLK